MSTIEFDEENSGTDMSQRPAVNTAMSSASVSQDEEAAMPAHYSEQPKMIQWLMRHHIANSSKAANAMLLAIVIICIICVYILIKFM